MNACQTMRGRCILFVCVLLMVTVVAGLLLARRVPGPRAQLSFAVINITVKEYSASTAVSGPRLLGWEIYPRAERTNARVTLRTATLQIHNEGPRTLDIFPMFAIEAKPGDLDPSYEAPRGLRRPLKPGELSDTQIILRKVGDRPWRVGVWHTEVRPAWNTRVRSWLRRVGLCPEERKVLEYSDWFGSDLNPTNKQGL